MHWEAVRNAQPKNASCTQVRDSYPGGFSRATKFAPNGLSRNVCGKREFRDGPNGSQNPAEISRSKPPALQKEVFQVLAASIKNPWPKLINSKLQILGADVCAMSAEEWHEFLVVFKNCPLSVKTCFLKTIINSWATSHRMSEGELLPCIFGCECCEDNLKHYLTCEPLWTLVVSACGLPASYLGLPILDRLCLRNKSTYALKLLRVVYSVYHALKVGHRELITQCIANNHFEVIYELIIPISKETWDHH